MKAFICLLVLAASANAGVLHGGFAGPGVGGLVYGGGLEHVHSQPASIIKVIHDHSHHHVSAPSIVKVIHEEGHHHQLVEAAPQLVQVVQEQHAPLVAAVPAVNQVQLVHEHAGADIGGLVPVGGYSSGVGHIHHVHGGPQHIKIIKVIQDHGW